MAEVMVPLSALRKVLEEARYWRQRCQETLTATGIKWISPRDAYGFPSFARVEGVDSYLLAKGKLSWNPVHGDVIDFWCLGRQEFEWRVGVSCNPSSSMFSLAEWDHLVKPMNASGLTNIPEVPTEWLPGKSPRSGKYPSPKLKHREVVMEDEQVLAYHQAVLDYAKTVLAEKQAAKKPQAKKPKPTVKQQENHPFGFHGGFPIKGVTLPAH